MTIHLHWVTKAVSALSTADWGQNSIQVIQLNSLSVLELLGKLRLGGLVRGFSSGTAVN